MPPENLQPQDHPTEPLLEAGLIQSKQIGDETNSLLEAIIQQNSENNHEPILEAQLMQNENNTNKIVDAIKDRPEVQPVKIVTEQNELADNFFRMLRGQKGEDGHTPTSDELQELILPLIPPLIPEPIKGEDGLTPTEEELLSLIVPLIPEPIKGEDGKTPTKAELRKIIEPLIPEPIKGEDGVSPVIDYKRVVKEAVKQIPPIEIEKQVKEIVEKVSQNTNDTIQSLRSKVASRTYSMGELSDTQSATTGQTMVKQADNTWAPGTASGGSGHTIEDEGSPLTQRAKLNFIGAGVTVTDDAGDDATVVTIPSGAGATPIYIDVRDYGATPDAKTVTDIVLTSGNTTATSATAGFVAGDTGKSMIVYDVINNTYPFRGTITYVNATTVTLSSNALASVSSGNGIAAWGTNYATQIQNAINAADTLVPSTYSTANFPTGRGRVTVVFPTDSTGDAYLFNTTLTATAGVTLDADATLISNVGTGASNRTWAMDLAAGVQIKNLVMYCMGGMGISLGDNSTNSSSYLQNVQLWHVGTDSTASSQIGLQFTGYDLHIGRYWIKGGNVGLDINQGSDVFWNQIELIGCSTGIRLANSENIRGTVTLDTISFAGILLDGCRNIQMDVHAFAINATASSYVVLQGEYDTTNINRNIDFNITAQRTGGTVYKVSNSEDCVVDINATNSAIYSGGGTNISTAVIYGTTNVNTGAMAIRVNRDAAITAKTGTVVGTFEETSDGTVIQTTAQQTFTGAVGVGGVLTITPSSGRLNFSGGGTSGIQQNGFDYMTWGSSAFNFLADTFNGITGGIVNIPVKPNASSGVQSVMNVNPNITQSATAGYTALLVNPTETSTGSGLKKLIEAAVGGVSKFFVDNTGAATFTGNVTVPDQVYNATTWNGSLEVPTKNAIRDKIESMSAGGISEELAIAYAVSL